MGADVDSPGAGDVHAPSRQDRKSGSQQRVILIGSPNPISGNLSDLTPAATVALGD
jgi:hypothetical protein